MVGAGNSRKVKCCAESIAISRHRQDRESNGEGVASTTPTQYPGGPMPKIEAIRTTWSQIELA